MSSPTAAAQVPAPMMATRPQIPDTVAETGLTPEAIIELTLKTLYVQGARSGQELVESIRLPFAILDELLLTLQHQRLVEVKRTVGAGRGGYIFDLTGAGGDRAREAMAACQYVGPAPVPLDQYRVWIERQSVSNLRVTRERLFAAFADLVLDPAFVESLGPAVNSAKSVFIFGDPGNGKTMMAEVIAGLLGGSFYLPYAVDIGGQIMVVFDPVYHRLVGSGDDGGAALSQDPQWLRDVPDYDRRFARVSRPVVITGGELTLEQLDLQYDRDAKVYQAPFQVKANGGVLILDDFGRQRVPPRELLNRWIMPLEKRIDYLTLHTGAKFPVPFESLVIFATNLDPEQLVEEAFLRRIHYKVRALSPTRAQYEEIFRRCAVARQIPYDPEGVAQVYRDFYETHGIAPRGCHPRDLTDHVCDIARFLGVEPTLSADLLDRACRSYFLDASEQFDKELGVLQRERTYE
jgi:predicted ATPase with chaperone activity